MERGPGGSSMFIHPGSVFIAREWKTPGVNTAIIEWIKVE